MQIYDRIVTKAAFQVMGFCGQTYSYSPSLYGTRVYNVVNGLPHYICLHRDHCCIGQGGYTVNFVSPKES
jgi:hypothetical protein